MSKGIVSSAGAGLRARVVVVATCAAALGAILVPGVGAQKVANPGPISISPTAGELRIRDLGIDLTPHSVPECADGIDNDADGVPDAADGGCAAGPGEPLEQDDSELAPGFQPMESTRFEGSIDGSGLIEVPVSGVSLPTAYVPVTSPFDSSTHVVAARVVATHPATGFLDPLSREVSLRLRMKVVISGSPMGIDLGTTCSVGTASAPIDVDVLTTGRAEGTSPPMTGSPYNALTGSVRLVNNTFSVPGASGCPRRLLFDVNAMVNQQLGLPSPSGSNSATLTGKVSPPVQRAIVPSIRVDPPFGPADGTPRAPRTVTFDASGSAVAKGPAGYAWEIREAMSGTVLATGSGPRITHLFTEAGFYEATVTVTDTDGDSASTTWAFPLAAPSSTTTEAPSTTTTEAPSTTTTEAPSTTTTEAPSTTTTEAPSTTTTEAPSTVPSTTPAPLPTTVTTAVPSGGRPTTTVRVPTATTPPVPAVSATTAPVPAVPATTVPATTVPATTVPARVGSGRAGGPAISGSSGEVRRSRPRARPSTGVEVAAATTNPSGGTGGSRAPASGTPRVEVRTTSGPTYLLAGELLWGDLSVRRDRGGATVLGGGGMLPGPAGEPALVAVEASRAWVLTVFTGRMTVADPHSGVLFSVRCVAKASESGGVFGGTASGVRIGTGPRPAQPVELRWELREGTISR